MRFAAYPKYKPSGVEWLGDVPEHWDVKRGRFCMDVNPGSPRMRTLRSDDEVSFVPMEAVGEYGGLELGQTRAIADVGSGYTEFEDGDVVVAKITPCFENGKGALATGLLNGAAFGTTELHVLRSDPILERRFLFYFSISRLFRSIGEGEMYGAGGQKRVPPEFCENVRLPLPPIDDQFAIADFLDRATAKIGALVAKKRMLIERLKEKRTALISRTVTRGLPPDAARAAGLDPHPKLKPSGIDWLGDVPEHWRVTRLMYVTDQARPIMYGIVLPGPDVDDGVPIVKGGDVKPGRLSLEKLCRTTPEIEAGYVRSRLKASDLVFSIRGTVGEAELVPEEIAGANLTQDAARIAPGATANSRWLLYTAKAKAIIDPLLSLSLGAAVRGVNIRDLKRTVVLLPPADAQQVIAEWLDTQTSLIDEMERKVETAIKRLQEYRTALITAAVTGKIDVRGLSGADAAGTMTV
ncbi:restriction endonuclease subunit S [Accumulibacter sp.]|uniref:restriction endonuclease subunit S n=1 Tax=Accumulibacter sp. TaxID=2053492 RepID=UPI0025FD29D2|nr:restriction endonuclease subunit S [Accumulibacter sp.]MCM8626954.1 restriction endonuclease subunit S [Accumulibacter sp.]